jgi:hypothetical protein
MPAHGHDPFGPPKIATLVGCLHCRQVYESYLIEWRELPTHDGTIHGFWCCPIEDCDGKEFGFDIFPIDPDWTDEDGNRMWVDDESEEEDYPVEPEDEVSSDKPAENGGEDIPY